MDNMVDTSSGSLLTAEERVTVGEDDDVVQSQTTAKNLLSSQDGGDVHCNDDSTTQDEMDVVTSTSESNMSSRLHIYALVFKIMNL